MSARRSHLPPPSQKGAASQAERTRPVLRARRTNQGLLALVALCVFCAPASGQIRTPGASAVSEHEGPIGEHSRPIGEGSRPVGDGLSIGDASRGPIHSGPVSEMNTRSMRSGPVSSMSRGPMSAGKPMTGSPSITEASSGAVKHDSDMPLGERISAPLRELAPLQQQLKALRQQGDAAAVEAAAAPLAAEPAEEHELPLDEPLAEDGVADGDRAAGADSDRLPPGAGDDLPATDADEVEPTPHDDPTAAETEFP